MFWGVIETCHFAAVVRLKIVTVVAQWAYIWPQWGFSQSVQVTRTRMRPVEL